MTELRDRSFEPRDVGLEWPDPAGEPRNGTSAQSDADERLRRALELAFRRLNRRELTVLEMRRHLERNGVDDATIEAALQELSEQRYLDDSRFARLFAEDRRTLDEWGAERIRRTLQGRGIDREVIEAALEQADDDGGSELDRAVALLRRKFASPPRERRERDRALGVLLRKGYDGDLALDAIAAFGRGSGAG
jgi:regulatory protein